MMCDRAFVRDDLEQGAEPLARVGHCLERTEDGFLLDQLPSAPAPPATGRPREGKCQ
jgi:hypothetical protein